MADDLPLSRHCQALAHPHWFPVTLASFLVVGVVFSYVPQHLKIIQRRSSAGLSPWWVLLGSLSSIAAFANIMTLPTSRADMRCCREISGGACAAAFLGVLQIGCQWLCFMLINFLFAFYFPRRDVMDTTDPVAATADAPSKTNSEIRQNQSIFVSVTTWIFLLCVGVLSLVFVFLSSSSNDLTQGWADLLGIFGGVTAAVQYVPQIYTTWILKDAKSLSIVTMLIQVPGAVVLALSLWLRVGWQGWSTWFIYLLTAALQSVVLVLAVFYAYQSRNDPVPSSSPSPDDSGVPHERTALLGGQPERRQT